MDHYSGRNVTLKGLGTMQTTIELLDAAGYRVVEKIAAAKVRGDLDEIFGDECCEFCGAMLALEFAALAPVSPASELDRLRRRVAVLEVLIRPGVEVPGRSVTSVS